MEGMDYTARNKTQNGKKKGEMRRGERNQEVKFYKVIKTQKKIAQQQRDYSKYKAPEE